MNPTYEFNQRLPIDISEAAKSLDPGIREIVELFNAHGIETFQSCEGGKGHAFQDPTIQFYGDLPEGYYALSVAVRYGYNVRRLGMYINFEYNRIREGFY